MEKSVGTYFNGIFEEKCIFSKYKSESMSRGSTVNKTLVI